jgi:hypothetical protein
MRHRHLAKAAGQQQLLATYSHRASRRLYRFRGGRRSGSARERCAWIGIADRLGEFGFAGQAGQLLLPQIEERRDDGRGLFLAHLHPRCGILRVQPLDVKRPMA